MRLTVRGCVESFLLPRRRPGNFVHVVDPTLQLPHDFTLQHIRENVEMRQLQRRLTAPLDTLLADFHCYHESVQQLRECKQMSKDDKRRAELQRKASNTRAKCADAARQILLYAAHEKPWTCASTRELNMPKSSWERQQRLVDDLLIVLRDELQMAVTLTHVPTLMRPAIMEACGVSLADIESKYTVEHDDDNVSLLVHTTDVTHSFAALLCRQQLSHNVKLPLAMLTQSRWSNRRAVAVCSLTQKSNDRELFEKQADIISRYMGSAQQSDVAPTRLLPIEVARRQWIVNDDVVAQLSAFDSSLSRLLRILRSDGAKSQTSSFVNLIVAQISA